MTNIWRRRTWVLVVVFLLLLPLKVGAEMKEGLEDEMVYSIVVDRFYNGDPHNDAKVNIHDAQAYQGGDIKGIIKRLDYIKEMGFTAIMVTPLVDSKSYDGYKPTGEAKINPHFGAMEDVVTLVQEAHKRDMKVIVEWVMQEEEAMIDYAVFFVTETNMDGFYIRNTKDTNREEVHIMMERIQGEKKDFLFLGEDNFQHEYHEQMKNVLTKTNVSVKSLYDVTARNLEQVQAVFLDNNETKRFARVAKENEHYPPTRLKLALTYLYTTPHIPVVYYGTEIAIDGGEIPDNRRLMDFKTDKDFLHYVTTLGEIRNSRPSLRRGEMELLHDQNGMSVIKRSYEGETSLVVMNNTTETQKVTLSSEELDGKQELRGLLEEGIVRKTDGKYHLVVERETANIYAVGEKTGLNWWFILAIVSVNVAFIAFLIAVKKRKKSS
ncbi:alpha-amylase family glycosyl hydrolase [Bacillus manliponensis]|uniref:alpha-amylase family glycosyl hydrolase n=1 Tax=Bacillus manliponensis TaxID=574376 RepID=UPI0006900376|nr:alpha-amylase family glycosyl hydrolase [Bacillus manliponensis]